MGQRIVELGAGELRRAVASRELSPREVVAAVREQVERYNGRINALCTLSETLPAEAAELEARLAAGEPPGALCGVPVGIKDTTEVGGLRTTYGSPLFADHVPERDALVVSRMRRAGALVVGKTNTPELAAGGNTFNELFGRTRNPWDLQLSAGGSTGGGAAALAAGMIALAEGTDLGGSLRMPASFCGVVGLRPTPGLVPTHPSRLFCDTLSVTGPMARNTADVALLLTVMAGPAPEVVVAECAEGRDFFAAVARGPHAGCRLAYCPDLAGIGIDPRVERVCREAVSTLAADGGVEVEEVTIELAGAREAFLTLRGLWMVTAHRELLDRLAELGPSVRGNIEAGLRLDPLDVARAEGLRCDVRRELLAVLSRYDQLLTPTMAVPPFPVEEDFPRTVGGRAMETYIDWFAPTFVLSLTALPVASVPCGLDEEGLPVGLQVVGRPRSEEEVLALCAQVEALCAVGRPPLVTAAD
jgi:amidase